MQITIHSMRFDAQKLSQENQKLTQFDDELISSDVFIRIENATDKSNKLVEVKINTGFNELFALRFLKRRLTLSKNIDKRSKK